MIYQKELYSAADEKKFLAWVRTLPSSLSGDTENIVAAHVRRVKFGAGMACKPRLFAVALTNEEHLYQHQHGEDACFHKFASYGVKLWFDLMGVEAFFEQEALRNSAKWLHLQGRSIPTEFTYVETA